MSVIWISSKLIKEKLLEFKICPHISFGTLTIPKELDRQEVPSRSQRYLKFNI